MDAKFTKRYESFRRSLAALAEAKHRDLTDAFVLSGTGAKFCITFELAWKVMKDILLQHYAVIDFVAGSPREVLRQAFKAELIQDDTWMEMLKVRNELAHDYDETVIRKSCEDIRGKYLELFMELEENIDRIIK